MGKAAGLSSKVVPVDAAGREGQEGCGVEGFLQVKWSKGCPSFLGGRGALLRPWLWRSEAMGSACLLLQRSVMGPALEMDRSPSFHPSGTASWLTESPLIGPSRVHLPVPSVE